MSVEDEEVIRSVVTFWLGPSIQGPDAAEQRRHVWYEGGAQLDDEIRERFGEHVQVACDGGFDSWRDSGQGVLALVILLDQFTRNLYRSTPRAYAGDERALQVAEAAVDAGLDRDLPVTGRLFLYHPFHHAEDLVLQDRAVALVDAVRHEVGSEWHEFLKRRVAGFFRHREIVARFGRFPHRNRVLQRQSTPQEQAFLDAEHERFGQG